MGAQATAVGCLVGLNHYSGQDIPAIGQKHQPSAVKAWFAGFRPRCISFYILALSLFSNVADIAAP